MKKREIVSGWFWIGLAVLAIVPALYLKYSGLHLSSVWNSVLFGLAILGAASILAWASEAAQAEISQSLALAFLALVAVLPEYSVDLYFAITAAKNPQYVHYAVANMTGGNRLLIGIGWSMIPVFLWLGSRNKKRKGKSEGPRTEVVLQPEQKTEITVLIIAAIYSLVIPLKGTISLVDTVILFILFGLYLYLSYRAGAEEFEGEGPSLAILALEKWPRRLATIILFIIPAGSILLFAKPFADSLVLTGESYGIDQFLLVQWVAPLASEAPELIAVSIFAFKGAGSASLSALISSKVNQWTLLIGSLALAYSISLGHVGALPLDSRQTEELFLTSAQTIFAIALIANLRFSIKEAIVLFVLFAAQLFVPITPVRYGFAFFYIAAAVFILARDRGRIVEIGKMMRDTGRSLLPKNKN